MALSFPASPTNGQGYYDPGSGVQYVYQSSINAWKVVTTFPVASQPEVDALSIDTKFVTPLKLGNGFAISLTQNGYVKLPSWLGGLVLQWGRVTGVAPNNGTTANFPVAFTTACYVCVANWGAAGAGCGYTFRNGLPTTTALNWAWDVPASVGAGTQGVVQWWAVGK